MLHPQYPITGIYFIRQTNCDREVEVKECFLSGVFSSRVCPLSLQTFLAKTSLKGFCITRTVPVCHWHFKVLRSPPSDAASVADAILAKQQSAFAQTLNAIVSMGGG